MTDLKPAMLNSQYSKMSAASSAHAEFDTGAVKNAMILSPVPGGDDKPLKYPLMFSICDVVLINKSTFSYFDFDVESVKNYIKRRNPNAKVFMICAKTGEGVVDEWANWLLSRSQELERRSKDIKIKRAA